MLNLKHPEVRRFHYAAELHFESALELMKSFPDRGSSLTGHEVVYLAGYAVECGLKALFLTRSSVRHHGAIVDWLKVEVGHNLDKLKNELAKKGVVIPKEVLSELKRVNSNWSPEMRYQVHAWSRENTTRVLRAVELARGWIRGD